MRILLPTIELPDARGGVGRYIGAIAKTIPEVEVVAWSGNVDARGYDAVWMHHILPIGTQAWLQRMRGGVPYVIFLHGLDFDLARRNPWKRWLTRRILRGATHVVTNSKALAGEVAAFAGIAVPMVVYPCVSDELVVDAASHHPQPPPSYPRDKPPTEGSCLRLLTVGRLVERKGHIKVLEAMRDFPNLHYTIVGDGPMRTAIEKRIDELGLHDRVTVRTDVTNEEMPDVYHNADVFVMPSTKSATDREGFGIVYIEAAAFGVPSIAVRQPGVDEAILDGVTGWLIDDTVDALRDALCHIRSDRAVCDIKGNAAKVRVLAEFTREAQFGTLRTIV